MRIYADNAATTRVDERVAERVCSVMTEDFGNASSLHSVGKRARVLLDEARSKVAAYLGCDVGEVVWTSGGTEANNLAIRGVARACPEKKHIVTSVIEHPCVLETCRDLERDGYEVDYVGVDEKGFVSVDDVRKLIRDDTLLVSVMHVNNEVGVIQDVEEIGRVCREKGVLFHTDNVQGFLKEELALASIDLMSVSGHKVCAPKGVGFLYVKDGVRIMPILTGGGQEGGIRSGTENVAGIVGLAEAIDLDMKIDEVRWSRDKIVEGLGKLDGVRFNGDLEHRVYNNVSVSFYGIEGEALMLLLDEAGIQVSTGSACASSKLKGSYVLKAMGVDAMYLNGTIRISLGEDILGNEDWFVEEVGKAVAKLREMSPFKFSGENLEGSNSLSLDGSASQDGSESKILGGSTSLGTGATGGDEN